MWNCLEWTEERKRRKRKERADEVFVVHPLRNVPSVGREAH